MNEQVQKLFLDRRMAYENAKKKLAEIAKEADTVSKEWHTMAVIGRVNHSPWQSSNMAVFDPNKWPSADVVVRAWMACNQEYEDMVKAYRKLQSDDISYLGLAGEPGV
jgi:hypothetical protein